MVVRRRTRLQPAHGAQYALRGLVCSVGPGLKLLVTLVISQGHNSLFR